MGKSIVSCFFLTHGVVINTGLFRTAQQIGTGSSDHRINTINRVRVRDHCVFDCSCI